MHHSDSWTWVGKDGINKFRVLNMQKKLVNVSLRDIAQLAGKVRWIKQIRYEKEWCRIFDKPKKEIMSNVSALNNVWGI